MKHIVEILKEHSFFHGLPAEDIAFIAGCAKNIVFKEEQVIARQGEYADQFYLIREGRVAIAMEIPPQRTFIFRTLGPNDILGFSWLVPPYQWTFTAYAKKITHAIAIHGDCLREKCEKDPRLGFELMKRLVHFLVTGEDASRLQLLDIYGEKH